MDKEVVLNEYQVLRAEILMRANLLHQHVTVAAVTWVVLLVSSFISYSILEPELFISFLLFIPLVFSSLIFNYQDNQRTLERTAKYIEEVINPKFHGELEWEKWFAKQKQQSQFSSSYKVLVFLLPFLIPIMVLSYHPLNTWQTLLAIFDIVLLVMILVNFRYKLYRVK